MPYDPRREADTPPQSPTGYSGQIRAVHLEVDKLKERMSKDDMRIVQDIEALFEREKYHAERTMRRIFHEEFMKVKKESVAPASVKKDLRTGGLVGAVIVIAESLRFIIGQIS